MNQAIIAFRMVLNVIVAVSGMAEAPVPWEPLRWQNAATGDWGGVRQELADKGLTFEFQWDSNYVYNATGGKDTGDAWVNRVMPFVNWQLEPLLGMEGTEFQISGAWNTGDDINELAGSILTPTTTWREPAVRLYELWVGQSLLDDQVKFRIGRLGFGAGEYGYSLFIFDYMSSGYDDNAGGFFVNQPVTTFAFPIATWGARVFIEPNDGDYVVKFGVYNGWPRDLADGDKNGLDFSLNLDQSTFLISEFAYKFNQDPGDQGKPANLSFGVMYDTGPFERFDLPGEEKRGNFGYYVVGDLMLYRESTPVQPSDHPANWQPKLKAQKAHPSHQGLYIWGNFISNPDADINLFPYWIQSGLAYKGLFPGRDADRLGLGFYHGFNSSNIPLDDETHIEWFYRYQFTRWGAIGPDFQYIINPIQAGPRAGNAFVLGVNLIAHF